MKKNILLFVTALFASQIVQAQGTAYLSGLPGLAGGTMAWQVIYGMQWDLKQGPMSVDMSLILLS